MKDFGRFLVSAAVAALSAAACASYEESGDGAAEIEEALARSETMFADKRVLAIYAALGRRGCDLHGNLDEFSAAPLPLEREGIWLTADCSRLDAAESAGLIAVFSGAGELQYVSGYLRQDLPAGGVDFVPIHVEDGHVVRDDLLSWLEDYAAATQPVAARLGGDVTDTDAADPCRDCMAEYLTRGSAILDRGDDWALTLDIDDADLRVAANNGCKERGACEDAPRCLYDAEDPAGDCPDYFKICTDSDGLLCDGPSYNGCGCRYEYFDTCTIKSGVGYQCCSDSSGETCMDDDEELLLAYGEERTYESSPFQLDILEESVADKSECDLGDAPRCVLLDPETNPDDRHRCGSATTAIAFCSTHKAWANCNGDEQCYQIYQCGGCLDEGQGAGASDEAPAEVKCDSLAETTRIFHYEYGTERAVAAPHTGDCAARDKHGNRVTDGAPWRHEDTGECVQAEIKNNYECKSGYLTVQHCDRGTWLPPHCP